MEGYYLPFLAFPDVQLCESPIVRALLSALRANPAQPAGYNRRIVIDAHANVERLVRAEFHPAGARKPERLRFRQDRHARDDDFEIVRPQRIQRLGISALVRLVPGSLQLLKLSDIVVILGDLSKCCCKYRAGEESENEKFQSAPLSLLRSQLGGSEPSCTCTGRLVARRREPRGL